MKFLKKIQNDSQITSVEHGIVYYNETSDDITVKKGNIVLQPTKVWYDDGSYQEFNVTEIITSIEHFTTPFEDDVDVPTTQFGAIDTIKKIEIGDEVTIIKRGAFNGNFDNPFLSQMSTPKKLEEVIIGKNVSVIEQGAFRYSRTLSSITISNGVTSIDSYAINNCFALSSITIPNSVTSIGDYAFGGCHSLASVTYNGTNYTSKSELITALTEGDITLGKDVFVNTALLD